MGQRSGRGGSDVAYITERLYKEETLMSSTGSIQVHTEQWTYHDTAAQRG